MGEEKTVKMRRQGEHLKKNEAKIEIIKNILSENSGVLGPDIRSYLREKLGMVDRKNIEDHLKDLENKHCIEKFKRVGFENKWDIKKIENLKNIRKYFSEIELNKYEKSLIIILKNFGFKPGYNLVSVDSFKFYFRLLLSASFFDACMEAEPETMYSRTWEIYLYTKDFERTLNVDENLEKCYDSYIKNNTDSEISRETFMKTLEEIFLKICEERFPGWTKEMPRDAYLEIIKKIEEEKYEFLAEILQVCEERFPGWIKDMPRNVFLNFIKLIDGDIVDSARTFMEGSMWNLCEEKFPGMPSEKFLVIKEFMGTLNEEYNIYITINTAVNSMKNRFFEFLMMRFDLLFEHYFCQDILTGATSIEEREFAKTTRKDLEEYITLRRKSGYDKSSFRKMVTNDLKITGKMIFKFKQPSLFNKVYHNQDEIDNLLTKLLLQNLD